MMKFFKNKKFTVPLFGIIIGAVNGLMRAGGGMLAVQLLKKCGLEQKQAHSNAVAVILPITFLSAVLYLIKGYAHISDALVFIPTGIIGSFLGAYLLKKISPHWLKKLFGGFMIYAGIRLLLR